MTERFHVHVMVQSTADCIALGQAVEERFLDLCHAHLRIRGCELPIPRSLDSDVLRWRAMRIRHKRGDFRNTESEWSSTKAVAQWTLDVNSQLRNQQRQELDCLKT